MRRMLIFFSFCLLILSCQNPASGDGSSKKSPDQIRLLLDNPKGLFIAGGSTAEGRQFRAIGDDESSDELYQITAEGLIEKVGIVDAENESSEYEARILKLFKMSERLVIVDFEMYIPDIEMGSRNYKRYTLAVDITDGSTHDISDYLDLDRWTSMMYDEPFAVGNTIYTLGLDGITLYKLNLAGNSAIPLNNGSAMPVTSFLQLKKDYFIANTGSSTCILSDSLDLPVFLDGTDELKYLEEFTTAHNEWENDFFDLIYDAEGHLFDVDLCEQDGKILAELIAFDLDEDNKFTVQKTSIGELSDTYKTFDSASGKSSCSVTNSRNINDRSRMWVMDFGYIYVESKAPGAGFTCTVVEKDLRFLFDSDGTPFFNFYDSGRKACWRKDANTMALYDFIRGGSVEEVSISNLVYVYGVGEKVFYTKLKTSTSTQTFQYNPDGEDIVVSSSDIVPKTIIEF